MTTQACRWTVLAAVLLGLGAAPREQPGSGTERTWDVNGVKRTALVVGLKPGVTNQPVVFVFHGHGGTSRNAQRTYHIEDHWNDDAKGVVVVYPQGLPTVGQLTDPEGKKAGWDATTTTVGNDGNRDLAFVEAMMGTLRKEAKIDSKRVFVAGHSNGGSFTYLLWAVHGDMIRAVAPSGSVLAKGVGKLDPKPAIICAGRQDPLVKFAWQDAMITRVKKLNECAADEKAWGKLGTWFESKSGNPVVTQIYDGGHQPPKGMGEEVANFFHQLAKAGE